MYRSRAERKSLSRFGKSTSKSVGCAVFLESGFAYFVFQVSFRCGSDNISLVEIRQVGVNMTGFALGVRLLLGFRIGRDPVRGIFYLNLKKRAYFTNFRLRDMNLRLGFVHALTRSRT